MFFELFDINWPKNNQKEENFCNEAFCKKLTQPWKDNESCIFLLLCLFTTQNLQFYSHSIYKQEVAYILEGSFHRTITLISVVSNSISNMTAAIRIFHWGSWFESTKAIQSPIPGLKLATKVNKSRAMPADVPRVTAPGIVADKCLRQHFANRQASGGKSFDECTDRIWLSMA